MTQTATRNASRAPLLNHLIFLLAVLAIGAVAGAFVWAFLFAMNTCIDLLWHRLPNALDFRFFPLVVCTAGGLAIGLAQKRNDGLPEDMMTVLAQVKRNGGYDTKKVKPSALCAILPLIFGGSIGPEAGLVGVIAGLCTGAGAKLRNLGEDFRELAAAGTAASLSAVFGAPLFAIAAPLEGLDDKAAKGEKGPDANAEGSGKLASTERFPKWVRVCAYAIAAAGAFGVMALLNGITGGGAGLPRFESISFGNGEIMAAIPAAIAGAAAGWLFHAGEHLTHGLSHAIGAKPVLKAVIAGAVLGLCGCFLPFTMFAGEHQMHELMETWTTLSAGALLATGFIKVLLTPLCVSFGWRGGHFFPVIFAGMAIGYGFAILGGVDPVLAAAAGAGAVVGGVMRKPILATLLLFLCFPISASPVMLVAAGLACLIPLPKAWQPKEEMATPSGKVEPTPEAAGSNDIAQ